MTNFAKCIHLVMRLGVYGDTGQKWRARTEGIGSHSRYLEPAGGWTEVGLTGPGKGKTQANYSALSNLKCMLRKQSQILIKITGTGACIVFPLYLPRWVCTDICVLLWDSCSSQMTVPVFDWSSNGWCYSSYWRAYLCCLLHCVVPSWNQSLLTSINVQLAWLGWAGSSFSAHR